MASPDPNPGTTDDPATSPQVAPAEIAPAEATPTPSPPRLKLPTAVTFVIALGAIATLIFLGIAGREVWTLYQCGGLTDNLRPMLCGQPPALVDPRPMVLDIAHGLGAAIAMIVILAGFARLRAWAWVALMTWGGYVLARDLLWYYLFPADRGGRYLSMLFAALIVLSLNQEDIQNAFGIQRDSHDLVPLHGAENPRDRV